MMVDPTSSRARSFAREQLLRRAVLAAVWLASLSFVAPAARAQNQPPTPPGTQPPPAGTTPPQDPATPRVSIQGETVAISMNESNGMELDQFIKWTQEITGKRFVFSQQELLQTGQGGTRVNFLGTLIFPRESFEKEFFEIFQTMLYIKGFAIVPRGEGNRELLEIVAINGPRAREISNAARHVPVEDIEQYKNQTGVQILTSLPLKHINATVATNALRPFFAAAGTAQGGALTPGNVGTNSALLLQGYGPQVYAAVKLLQLVDVPAATPDLVVHVQPLDHAAPEEIEPILTDILESRQRIRQQALQEQGAAGGGAVQSQSQQQIKIVVNPSQRAIVLSGTQEQVNEALELIARLDVKGEPIDGAASVIRLKNVLAEELRQTLSQFVSEDLQAEQTAQQGQAAGAPQVRRTRKTVIQAHKESNSLLISAAQTKYAQILSLIDELDRRQPQVLIEAALVELTTGDLDRFGVELGLIDIKENGDFTRPFGFTSFGQSAFTDQDDDGIPDTRLPDFDNPLQGLTGGIISGGDFAVPFLISALSTDDRANILSLPSVLVNNNETAIVTTEEERPTLEQSQGTATTTSGSGEPRNAGITLEISPTISPNNYLRLNVSLEVSRFVGAFDPNSATGGGIVLRRSLQTQVTMPSDDTMVIGGVIEDSESYNDGGVPFLKDIPLLGWLFRRSESTSNKTNLYFFLTPTILDEDDFQDLWHLSLKKKLEAEDYIGKRRLQLIDHKWTGSKEGEARVLEDPGATVNDLDAAGENEMPTYRRAGRDVRREQPKPSGPDEPIARPPAPLAPPPEIPKR